MDSLLWFSCFAVVGAQESQCRSVNINGSDNFFYLFIYNIYSQIYVHLNKSQLLAPFFCGVLCGVCVVTSTIDITFANLILILLIY